MSATIARHPPPEEANLTTSEEEFIEDDRAVALRLRFRVFGSRLVVDAHVVDVPGKRKVHKGARIKSFMFAYNNFNERVEQ
jgi:hypothetical protein